ncbi:AGAP011982-PA, partial [Anopheles gambiae str. PEST]
MLAVIDRAIELKRGFRLRDTQRLTILALLTNTKSTLAQVSTGEGKSLIVVATSIVKALFHNKVDIVTSSPVLAKRDSEVNKDIYELFGVSVHHNCSEDLEQRKEAYSNYQVVYGDLASFQRDYLLDKFYGKNILGDRDFSCVIVDEVDSMLVDKGNNMLYLSHDIPGMDKLESVYVFIWQVIGKNTGTDQGSSQWDEALHQFLQLKHGCKLSMQSLKAVFLSNVSYFKLYKRMYGLTGTLGSQGERHLLKEVHQVDFVTIPPTKSKQFDEYDPIICLGHNKWLESIRTEVDTLVNEQHRSVLIICDTINDVQSVEKCLKAKGELHISTYTRDFEEFDVVQGTAKLQQGEIIIATNLAGRGTDIR